MRIGRWTLVFGCTLALGSAALAGTAGAGQRAGKSVTTYLSQLKGVTAVGSTVPANGDVNPYGVAIVPASAGTLVAGDTLVSNFNSKANVQGTGTTIVEVSPSGGQTLFSQISSLPAGVTCPGGIGLSTALSILPGGWVVVGSLPTSSGGALTSADPAGCLLMLNNDGAVVESFSNSQIQGPWDMTSLSTPTGVDLFVSNALGGNTKTSKGVPVAGACTVVRLALTLTGTAAPQLASTTIVGSDYLWKANKAALVLAPTGLALGTNGTLFVDNSLNNTVSAITHAATRTTAVPAAKSVITKGGALNAPLGMVTAPNGDILVVNGNNGVATEISPGGKQVATKTLVKNGAGDLFGLAIVPDAGGILFVNDGTNALDLLHHRAA